MSKNIVIKVPSWVSEEEIERIVKEFLARIGGRLEVDEVRRLLGVRPEELTDQLEIYDVRHLRDKEKERLY